MEIYKNEYSKNEDALLWELHEIRHVIHETIKNKTIDRINEEALKKHQTWEKNKAKNIIVR